MTAFHLHGEQHAQWHDIMKVPNQENLMYRVWLPAERTALKSLSIHSSDYVFTVLVSIFMKTHNHFLSAIPVL